MGFYSAIQLYYLLALFVTFRSQLQCYSIRKYNLLDLNPSSGVYQINQQGYPKKIVDHDEGHIWNIPESPLGLDAPAIASSLNNPNAALYGYGGTNLHDGTTTTIRGVTLDPVPKVYKVSQVPEEENLKTVKQVIPKEPISFSSVNVPQVGSTMPLPPLMPTQTLPLTFNFGFTNPMSTLAGKMNTLGSSIGTLLTDFNAYKMSNINSPNIQSFPMIGVPKFSLLKSIVKRSALDNQIIDKAPINDNICTRDYSKKCPAGWEILNDFHCRAPVDYTGACPHILKIESMNAKEKSKMAFECKIHWPCMDDQCDKLEGIDYSAPCPDKWVFDGECVAPKNYQGNCNSRQNLSNSTASEKEKFASACQVRWPCRKQACERDYEKLCPEGWIYKSETDACYASKNNNNNCFVTPAGISHMSAMKRKAFEAECNSAWPCKLISTKCKRDYANYACPLGWENLMKMNTCLAPEDFAEKPGCPKMTNFDFFTTAEKVAFAALCNVEWPCSGSFEQDLMACPLYWQEITNGPYQGWCEPTARYVGPCNEKIDIKRMLQDQKETFVLMCEVEFPLIEQGKTLYGMSNLLNGTAVSIAPTAE